MIKGIIFYEQGGLQLIGELNSLAGIIATMKKVLPDFEKQEMERVFATMSVEQISELIKAKEATEANTGKTERL